MQGFKAKQGFANPRNFPTERFANPKAKAQAQGFANPNQKPQGFTGGPKPKEKFQNYNGAPAGAKDSYEAIGAFDGVRLSTGNSVSDWRHTKPDEPLAGNFPKFQPGPDNLFMFKDNQCKPECCGASYACDGGCVCTTPEQRNFINTRGGNRTAPDAGV